MFKICTKVFSILCTWLWMKKDFFYKTFIIHFSVLHSDYVDALSVIYNCDFKYSDSINPEQWLIHAIYYRIWHSRLTYRSITWEQPSSSSQHFSLFYDFLVYRFYVNRLSCDRGNMAGPWLTDTLYIASTAGAYMFIYPRGVKSEHSIEHLVIEAASHFWQLYFQVSEKSSSEDCLVDVLCDTLS